ncbi:hypothetical protein CC78DRAFT_178852 [Lojkania enalia]|uniref:F-box domain-containing protein n=1 Tax=Lojkania enalia TaxID=147567 RepID=A0A9P4K1I5_9PLEO|nr:hypothetical protein CC78DRAFT_178852 [Didymosphaeria enalia]
MFDDPTHSTALVELAPELLELILSYLAPRDLVSFGRTCRRANAFIHPNNQILWKSAFLQIFDNPKHVWDFLVPTARAAHREHEARWDWCREVRRRCNAFKAVCQASDPAQYANPEDVIPPLLDIADTASYSTDPGAQAPSSLNVNYLERLFSVAPRPEKIIHDWHRDIDSMSLPLDFLSDSNRPITRSMLSRRAAIPLWASRFHILYGMTEREEDSLRSKAFARAVVYDWSSTGPNADYGPLEKDGSGTVNWQMLEAIMSLMIRIFNHARGSSYRLPSGFRNNVPNSIPLNPALPGDWAGVTTAWVGTYAFMDYRALVHYNFANNLEFPMDLGSYDEACGDIMRLKLDINDSDDLPNDDRLKTDLPCCTDLPTIYFNGTSNGRSTGRPAILVRGFACLVPEGTQVRWRFIISYAGEDHWQLEGVQYGIRTGGIYGLWSHVEHDDHGPTGPFCYWPYDMSCRV